MADGDGDDCEKNGRMICSLILHKTLIIYKLLFRNKKSLYIFHYNTLFIKHTVHNFDEIGNNSTVIL